VREGDADGVALGVREGDSDGDGDGVGVREGDGVRDGDRDGTGVGVAPTRAGDPLLEWVSAIRRGTIAVSAAMSATAAAAASGVKARRRVKRALPGSLPRMVIACSSNGRTVSGRTVCAAPR
jgi:hypothetical protein